MPPDVEPGSADQAPNKVVRLVVLVCMALAGLLGGQMMPEALSFSILAPSARQDAAKQCGLYGSTTTEVSPVLQGGSSPALSKLLATRLKKGSVTPELESWALSLGSPAAPTRPDEVQSSLDALVADIRAKARADFVDKCVEIVSGKKLATFGDSFEDWVLFNSFFRSRNSSTMYGSGLYVDMSDGHPVFGNPAFFFDACLGWQGLCIPTVGKFRELYDKNRTCKVMPLCNPPDGGKGAVCMRLEELLVKENMGTRRIDLVTMMWKNAPYLLRCFPFDSFNAPLWSVRVTPDAAWRWKKIDLAFGAAGYWKAPSLMAQLSSTRHQGKKASSDARILQGTRHSSIFLRWPKPGVATALAEGIAVPAMVIGPLYREGQPLHGSAFPACDLFAMEGNTSCPASIPTVDASLERVKTRPSLCPAFQGKKHRLSW